MRGKGRAHTGGREWRGKGMREAGWATKMGESDGEEEVDEPEIGRNTEAQLLSIVCSTGGRGSKPRLWNI